MIRGILDTLSNGMVRLFSGTGRPGEEFSAREFLQHYGFASKPHKGAELVIMVNGNNIVSVADGDRRYTIKLQDGEAALFDDLGQRVHLTRDGIVAESSLKITARCPQIELDGDVNITGSLAVTKDISAEGDVSDFKGSIETVRKVHNVHDHNETGSITSPPQVQE